MGFSAEAANSLNSPVFLYGRQWPPYCRQTTVLCRFQGFFSAECTEYSRRHLRRHFAGIIAARAGSDIQPGQQRATIRRHGRRQCVGTGQSTRCHQHPRRRARQSAASQRAATDQCAASRATGTGTGQRRRRHYRQFHAASDGWYGEARRVRQCRERHSAERAGDGRPGRNRPIANATNDPSAAVNLTPGVTAVATNGTATDATSSQNGSTVQPSDTSATHPELSAVTVAAAAAAATVSSDQSAGVAPAATAPAKKSASTDDTTDQSSGAATAATATAAASASASPATPIAAAIVVNTAVASTPAAATAPPSAMAIGDQAKTSAPASLPRGIGQNVTGKSDAASATVATPATPALLPKNAAAPPLRLNLRRCTAPAALPRQQRRRRPMHRHSRRHYAPTMPRSRRHPMPAPKQMRQQQSALPQRRRTPAPRRAADPRMHNRQPMP